MQRRTVLAALAAFWLGGCAGGNNGNETPEPATDTPAPNQTPTPTSEPTPTESPTPTPEPTLEPQPPTPEDTPTPTARMTPTAEGLAPIHDQPLQTPQDVTGGGDFSEYDAPNLKTALAEQLNQARSAVGVPAVRYQTSLADRLSRMAQEHSEDMARARKAALEINDVTPEDRYDDHEISCAILDNNDKLVVQDDKIVLVGVTGASNAEDAATSLIRQWKRDENTNRIMTLKNAEHVGVGIAVINGNAYVMIAYC